MPMAHDILVREGEVSFAKPLPRALLRDRRLSWGARALFAFLWDCPGGWRPRIAHLSKMGPEGKDAVRARLRELERVGAMRVEPIQGDGGLFEGKRWVLIAAERWAVESPLFLDNEGMGKTEDRETRSSVKPRIVEPNTKVHRGKGSARNKESAKKKNNNPPGQNDDVSVSFMDGSVCLCRSGWMLDLIGEVNHAFQSGVKKKRCTMAAYAAGILAKWALAGRPSSRRHANEALDKKESCAIPKQEALARLAAARSILVGA